MDASLERPRLRSLAAQPARHGETDGLMLTDPLGLFDGGVFVPSMMLPILQRLDGERSIEDLVREVSSLTPATARKLIQQLDEGLLLESELFESTFQSTYRQFVDSGVRKAQHAGSHGYPDDPGECAEALDQILLGSTAGPMTAGPMTASAPVRATPRGLIAPHIDLGRGAEGYGHAYRQLLGAEPADLYVVFGTGHSGPSAPVTACPLDWDTPAGRLTTDRAFVAELERRLGTPAELDVWQHRKEHSIEFQMLFLAHLLGERRADVQVVGVLCGSLPTSDGNPDDEEWARGLVNALRETAEQSGKRVCWIAGADLSHVGPAFEDPDPVDAARREQLRTDELEKLAHLQNGDPGAFHHAVEGCGNPTHVCSAPAIYLASTLAGGATELLHYGQADAENDSCVTFCAGVLR